MSQDIINSLVNLEEDKTLDLIKKVVDESNPLVLIDALREAMTIVGQKFAVKEYYLTDMVYAAEIFHQAMKLIEPKLEQISADILGKIVIGTAKGDIHDIGKNIVASLLRCAGFEVFDLGVDVPPVKFIEKIKEVNPDIVGISGLLTTSFEPMLETIKLIEDAGVRSSIRVLVGGGPVNEEWAQKVKADAYGKDAVECVNIARKFCG